MKNENGAEIKIEKIEAMPEKKSFWQKYRKVIGIAGIAIGNLLTGFAIGRMTAFRDAKEDVAKAFEDLDKEPDVGAPFEE